MALMFRIFIVGLAFWVSGSPVRAQSLSYSHSCQKLFNPTNLHPMIPKTEVWANREIRYEHLEWNGETGGLYRNADIHPEIPDSEKFMVIFTKTHVFIKYRDFLLDSEGVLTIQIKSALRATNWFSGSLIFLFYDLPETTQAKIQSIIDAFHKRTEGTCVQLTCQYLNMIHPETFQEKSFYRLSSIIQYLLKIHSENNQNEIKSKIILLGNEFDQIKPYYEEVTRREKPYLIMSSLATFMAFVTGIGIGSQIPFF